jgi:hypothetical protein
MYSVSPQAYKSQMSEMSGCSFSKGEASDQCTVISTQMKLKTLYEHLVSHTLISHALFSPHCIIVGVKLCASVHVTHTVYLCTVLIYLTSVSFSLFSFGSQVQV